MDFKEDSANLERQGPNMPDTITATVTPPPFERLVRMACAVVQVTDAVIWQWENSRVALQAVAGSALRTFFLDDEFIEHVMRPPWGCKPKDLKSEAAFSERFRQSCPSQLRWCVSLPLHSRSGQLVGGLAVFCDDPIRLSGDRLRILQDLAAITESELQHCALARSYSELENNLDTVRRKLLRDDLTQIWNRAGILEILTREHSRARRQKQRLGLALVDLDHFKLINDQHGHLVGDRVLQTATARMVDAVRPYDAVGRYGGEEFLIVIVDNEPDIIRSVAERIRKNIADAPITAARNAFPITASVGVAYSEPQHLNADIWHLLQNADEALYAAKRNGRNCVSVAAVGDHNLLGSV